MKLVSKEILKDEYYQTYPNILTKRLIYFNTKTGGLVKYYQTTLAVNHKVVPHLKYNEIMQMTKSILYRGKGIVISKKKKKYNCYGEP